MKKVVSLLLCAAAILSSAALLSGCKGTEYPVEIANYSIKQEPLNVVVLDAATADIMSYMGYERKFAGRSDSVNQETLSAAPSVGTASNPDINQIQFLGAEIVFAGDELTEGSRTKLEEANIQVIRLQHAQTSAEVETNYISLGRILEGNKTGEKEGRDAYDRLLSELEAQKKEIEGLNGTGALNTLCYLYLEDGKLKQLTNETYGNILMSYTNCINVAVNSDQSTVDTQVLAGANPNYIFYSDEETLAYIKSDAFLSKLASVKGNKMKQISLDDMSRPGFTAVNTLKSMIEFIYNKKVSALSQTATQPATKADSKAAETTQPATKAAETTQPETKAQETTAAATQPATKAADKPATTTAPAADQVKSVADEYKIKLDNLKLEKTNENGDVKTMQQRLFDLGYVDDKENITGYYGDVTEQAVKDFQKKSGIKETGSADNATLTAMFKSDAKKAK